MICLGDVVLCEGFVDSEIGSEVENFVNVVVENREILIIFFLNTKLLH